MCKENKVYASHYMVDSLTRIYYKKLHLLHTNVYENCATSHAIVEPCRLYHTCAKHLLKLNLGQGLDLCHHCTWPESGQWTLPAGPCADLVPYIYCLNCLSSMMACGFLIMFSYHHWMSVSRLSSEGHMDLKASKRNFTTKSVVKWLCWSRIM